VPPFTPIGGRLISVPKLIKLTKRITTMCARNLSEARAVLVIGILINALLMQTTFAGAGKDTPPSSIVEPPSAKKYGGLKVCVNERYHGKDQHTAKKEALRRAIHIWYGTVLIRGLGDKWASWGLAADKIINCKLVPYETYGVLITECEVSARPCSLKSMKIPKP
jgi:hypothetical protein